MTFLLKAFMLREMKKALLIISHGSRRSASNEEVVALVSRIRGQSEGLIVAHAFLEIAEPTVSQTINRLVESGVTGIQVFPHFLAAGTHVSKDIPREVDLARTEHPDIQFNILPHLGALKELPSLILETTQSKS